MQRGVPRKKGSVADKRRVERLLERIGWNAGRKKCGT